MRDNSYEQILGKILSLKTRSSDYLNRHNGYNIMFWREVSKVSYKSYVGFSHDYNFSIVQITICQN